MVQTFSPVWITVKCHTCENKESSAFQLNQNSKTNEEMTTNCQQLGEDVFTEFKQVSN